MLRKQILLLLIVLSLCVLTSCKNEKEQNSEKIDTEEPTTEDTTIVETEEVVVKKDSVLFLIPDKTLELNTFRNLVIDNLADDSLKSKVNKVVDEAILDLNEALEVQELTKITNKCISDVHALIPTFNGTVDYTILSDQEKRKINVLLDNYLYRTELLGLPRDNAHTLPINALDAKTWEEFFGVNGKVLPNTKDKYWDVKPIMSNDNFLKGLSLATEKEYSDDLFDEKLMYNINIAGYPYYHQDVKKARKYFKAALDELVEAGVYDISNLSEPINITINFVSYEPFNENIFQPFKKEVLEAFNHESVTGGNFVLDIVLEEYDMESLNEIIVEREYVGRFDIGTAWISGSNVAQYTSYYIRSMHRDVSGKFSVTFGIDTNSYLEDAIIYNGYKYTYDAMVAALLRPSTLIEDGKFVSWQK